MIDCPVCNRCDDESRAQAWRRVEEAALRKPTANNKRRARMARACFEPLSERLSKIWFLSQAQKPFEEMDMSLHEGPGLEAVFDPIAWILDPREKARRLAESGRRLAPPVPRWVSVR